MKKQSGLSKISTIARSTMLWVHKCDEHPEVGSAICMEKMFGEQCIICDRRRELELELVEVKDVKNI